jgi:hypothetical protein
VSYVSLLWFYLLLPLFGVLCFTTVVLFITTSNWCLMFHYCGFIYCYLYLVSYVSLLWFYLLLPLIDVLCFTTVVLFIATSIWCLMFHYCGFIYYYLYLVSYVSLLWFYLLLPLIDVLCFTTVALKYWDTGNRFFPLLRIAFGQQPKCKRNHFSSRPYTAAVYVLVLTGHKPLATLLIISHLFLSLMIIGCLIKDCHLKWKHNFLH